MRREKHFARFGDQDEEEKKKREYKIHAVYR